MIICEGPVDAAACFAAGLPLAVAINGKTYKHPEHFAGLERAVLALDSDDAGQGGRADLYLALTALGVSVLLLPAAALEFLAAWARVTPAAASVAIEATTSRIVRRTVGSRGIGDGSRASHQTAKITAHSPNPSPSVGSEKSRSASDRFG